MLSITSLPFAQLKNAEHVSFFNNVVLAITKLGAEDLGLSGEQFNSFKSTVAQEQDIVLKAQGSMYTADMEALDKERDVIFRKIRLKLEAVCLESEKSPIAALVAPLQKYIMSKYNANLISLPYQEESAHLSGFDLDMRTHFTDEDLAAMGIADDMASLKVTNTRFSDMYNERATERSGGTSEMSKKLRAESEGLYGYIKLSLEFTANMNGETEKGEASANAIGVINEIVRDAHQRLNQRLGRGSSSSSDSELGGDVSPIPYPKA